MKREFSSEESCGKGIDQKARYPQTSVMMFAVKQRKKKERRQSRTDEEKARKTRPGREGEARRKGSKEGKYAGEFFFLRTRPQKGAFLLGTKQGVGQGSTGTSVFLELKGGNAEKKNEEGGAERQIWFCKTV